MKRCYELYGVAVGETTWNIFLSSYDLKIIGADLGGCPRIAWRFGNNFRAPLQVLCWTCGGSFEKLPGVYR